MLKLFQINCEGATGAPGKIAEEIGRLAILNGWDSYIAFGRRKRPSRSKTIQIGSNLGILFHVIQTRLFDKHGLGSKNATIRLVRQIKEVKPDIIHLHNLHGYYINIEILFNYLTKASIPVVWTLHDCWPITGHCAYFDHVGCDKWKSVCFDCPEKKEYPASHLIDRSTKNYYLKRKLFTSVQKMTIVTVSKWQENIVLNSFLGKISLQTIFNGIDLSIFKPQNNAKETRVKYGIGERFLILGVASPWSKRKGLDDLVELSKYLDNDKEVIVLIGLNNKQLKQIPKNIIGLSRTENTQDLADLYSAADLFVNPTWEDNFPTTNLEALACGTPVLTYRTGGSVEAITSETGFILEKGDIKGIINVVRSFQKSDKKRYLENCTKHAAEHYCRDDRFSEYFNIYKRIIGDKQMKKYQICTKTIMDTSDSNIIFNKKGESDYYINFTNKILPAWHVDQESYKKLMQVADKLKKEGSGKDFDCILGLSGGLDSSYVAYVAKEIMGLRPLLFHVDAGWNTDKAVGNIEKLCNGLGLDLYTDVINWEEMKDLQTAFLKSQIADQDLPQDYAFFSGLYKFAKKNKVKYVLTGANFSTECCREPEQWGGFPGIDCMLVKDIHSKFGKRKLETFPLVDILTYKLYYRYILGMKVFNPLNFVPYIKKDAEKLLQERFGWEPFQHKHHESRFTRFYEDFWLPGKFGFDKRRAHFSSLILTGQMSREEALERIAKPELSEEFLQKEFDYVADKLDLTRAELQEIFDGENKTFHDYRTKIKLIRLGGTIMKILGLEKRFFR